MPPQRYQPWYAGGNKSYQAWNNNNNNNNNNNWGQNYNPKHTTTPQGLYAGMKSMVAQFNKAAQAFNRIQRSSPGVAEGSQWDGG
eukprot:12403595-Karenia_brevis.AAC.1